MRHSIISAIISQEAQQTHKLDSLLRRDLGGPKGTGAAGAGRSDDAVSSSAVANESLTFQSIGHISYKMLASTEKAVGYRIWAGNRSLTDGMTPVLTTFDDFLTIFDDF